MTLHRLLQITAVGITTYVAIHYVLGWIGVITLMLISALWLGLIIFLDRNKDRGK